MGSQEEKIQKRIAIGERRIQNILRKHGVATMRMLEQKISNAGPNPQRVDPHLLTKARISLVNKGILKTHAPKGVQWHYLTESGPGFLDQRFNLLSALHAQTESRSFTDRMGDTAEIAVMKAMQRSRSQFFGHFTDLGKHDDSQRYTKHDPDCYCGIPIEGGKLDYILVQAEAGGMGIEIKNTREWIYPDKNIVTELLDGYPCEFRHVDPSRYKETLTWTGWFYKGAHFPALQLFWPDRVGHFPWDSCCEEGIRNAQPDLSSAPTLN